MRRRAFWGRRDKVQGSGNRKRGERERARETRGGYLEGTTSLLKDGVDDVVVLHLEFLGRLVGLDALTVKEEADGTGRHGKTGAVRVKETLEGSSLLNLEEDLVSVLFFCCLMMMV